MWYLLSQGLVLGGAHDYSATCTPVQFSLLSEVMARYSDLQRQSRE